VTAPGASAVIFDLDGVLVDTARFHLAAWRRIAGELDFSFDDSVGEALKGVGRDAALRVILRTAGIEMTPEEAAETARRKNAYYGEHISTLDASALLPGAADALLWLRDHGVPIALASASRNARTILASTGIEPLFDAIVDGTTIALAKPDPAVFLAAAEALGQAPGDCIVFEDAIAGVTGALLAGCRVIGIGDPGILLGAENVVDDLSDVPWSTLFGKQLP
jgi:beta-phosphoglucomutase